MNNEVTLTVNPESHLIHAPTPSPACHVEDARLTGSNRGADAVQEIPLKHLRIYQNHGYRMCDRCFPINLPGINP